MFIDAWNLQSSNPPFTSVELDHSDSGREGCTVTTLTITAEPKNWQNAIRVAVQEVCFLCCALIVCNRTILYFSFHWLFQLVILRSILFIFQLLVFIPLFNLERYKMTQLYDNYLAWSLWFFSFTLWMFLGSFWVLGCITKIII